MTSEHFPQRPPDGLNPVDYISRALQMYGEQGEAPYRWARNPASPILTPLRRPLDQARIALVSSGGVYRRGQVAFHYRNDTSYRRIPVDAPADELRIAHFGYDTRNARRDPNVILPIAALRALVGDGTIGALCPFALTFMGGIYSQRRVAEELLPPLREELARMAPDAVLLVPACPICHQTTGILARSLEEAGFPTLMMSSAFSITALVHPPRAAFLDYPLGHTAGRPHEPEEQQAIMRDALSLLQTVAQPGEIHALEFSWPGDWKTNDPAQDYDWPERFDCPHYHHDEDRDAAVSRHGERIACGADTARRSPPD